MDEEAALPDIKEDVVADCAEAADWAAAAEVVSVEEADCVAAEAEEAVEAD